LLHFEIHGTVDSVNIDLEKMNNVLKTNLDDEDQPLPGGKDMIPVNIETHPFDLNFVYVNM
jgi:hypothetical protein